jgi:hypothetical protein
MNTPGNGLRSAVMLALFAAVLAWVAPRTDA